MRVSAICLSILLLASCGGGGGGGGGGPTPSEPDEFFVRAIAGNDANDGTSPTTAFQTIAAGLSRISDGDTLIVGPGTYTEAITNPRGGIEGSPVVLRGDPSGNRTGDPAGLVIIDASTSTEPDGDPLPGIRLSGVEFVEVDGFSVKGGGPAGIHIRSASRDGQIVGSSNITIRNCQVFDNRDAADGIRIQDSTDILVFNNLIFRNDRRGIAITGSPRVSLINNTISDNADRGIFLSDRDGEVASTNAFLRNNISQNNGPENNAGERTRNLQVDPGPPSSIDGFDSETNLIFPAGYQPPELPHPSDINADALFVNPRSGNFRISQPAGGQPENSPALDAGLEQSAPGSPPVDYDSLRMLTTAGNGAPDTGVIDLGYHAPPEQPTVGGATWYVRIAGDDENDGTSIATAVRTIAEAANRVDPGDRVVVGPGTYEETVPNVPTGENGLPVVFFADAKGDLTGDPDGPVIVASRNAPAAFRLSSVDFVVIDGFVVTGGTEAGITVRSGSTNVTVRNCQARDNEVGILVENSDDVLVFNNLVVDNDENGIEVGGQGGADNVRVINNTVFGNGDRGIVIGTGSTPADDALVQNNIVQGNADNNLQTNDPSSETVAITHNLVFPDSYSPGNLDHGSDLNDDALFVGGDDFHLTELSPAIDAGDPATNPSLRSALSARSAVSNGDPDTGAVDLGFHFPR